MEYDPQLGVYDTSLPWVPSIAHLVRRSMILNIIDGLKPGKTLEMGCGAGAIIYDLALRGFSGVGVDQSSPAIAVAEKILGDHRASFQLQTKPPEKVKEFQYLLAFEVLEHVEHDHEALRSWVDYLAPGGIVILSVPAHSRKWELSDEWAGHFRRYDRDDLVSLVENAGLEIVSFESYGFPILSLLRPFRQHISRKKLMADKANSQVSLAVKTAKSGVDRKSESRIFSVYSSLPGRIALRAATWVQRLFAKTDLGTGYVVVAQRH